METLLGLFWRQILFDFHHQHWEGLQDDHVSWVSKCFRNVHLKQSYLRKLLLFTKYMCRTITADLIRKRYRCIFCSMFLYTSEKIPNYVNPKLTGNYNFFQMNLYYQRRGVDVSCIKQRCMIKYTFTVVFCFIVWLCPCIIKYAQAANQR